MTTIITVADGKYTISYNGDDIEVRRYGKDCVLLQGDGLVLALVQEIERLQEKIQDMNDEAWERSLGWDI
jgi:hypothetical protein